MEKKVNFNSIFMSMVKREKIAPVRIVVEKFLKLQLGIGQLFTVKSVKNNKVDRVSSFLYTIDKMPNTKSAIRRVRRVKKQTQTNRIRKSKYKNAVKQMELLIKNKEKEKAKKYFSKFQSILMQVAKSGIINKNRASRKISRISKKIK